MNRYRFPIAILALSALTLLLFFTASPDPTAQAAPRSIPWDCSDWQESPAVADADDARVSMILETLAANRGKSIYCAIDQSDTWTKSETWLAGRDRNERDDTVYFGQSGNFRGFLAAQEGYLTDGESGVTGVSRDLIFEFPREERRRRTITKRLFLEPSADFDQRVWSEWGGRTEQVSTGSRILQAQYRFTDAGFNTHFDPSIPNTQYGWPHSRVDNWPTLLREKGNERCRALGYQRGVNPQMSFVHPETEAEWLSKRNEPSSNPGWIPGDTVTGLAWPADSVRVEYANPLTGSTTSEFNEQAEGAKGDNAKRLAANANAHYAYIDIAGNPNWYGWARQSFPFSVTCIKKIRKRR